MRLSNIKKSKVIVCNGGKRHNVKQPLALYFLLILLVKLKHSFSEILSISGYISLMNF